jgi:hypothetical protein
MHANRQVRCCGAEGTASTRKDHNSFELDSIAMELYRGVYKHMIHVWIKGIVKRSCTLPGTCMPIDSSAAWLHGQQAWENW